MAAMRLLFVGAAGISAFYFLKENKRMYAISYGRHVYDGEEKRTTWDKNWDHRQPIKNEDLKKEGNGDKGKSEASTATRHLILVRHGQYVMDDDPDKKVYIYTAKTLHKYLLC